MSMSDDDLWRIFQEAPAPDTSAMSYTQACNAQDLAGLRAVERAARAAAFREAAEVCERMHDEHERQSRGLYDPYTAGCLDTASELADALRARADSGGER